VHGWWVWLLLLGELGAQFFFVGAAFFFSSPPGGPFSSASAPLGLLLDMKQEEESEGEIALIGGRCSAVHCSAVM
jgi:hypothetical protein